jgi:two-component system sensor histidine kinase ArlS
MKTSKVLNEDKANFGKLVGVIGMRIVVGVGLLLKNIMLLPMRLLLMLVNKLGNLFRFSLTFKIGIIYTTLILIALLIFNFSLLNGAKLFMLYSETTLFEETKGRMMTNFSMGVPFEPESIIRFADAEKVIVNVFNSTGDMILTSNDTYKFNKMNLSQSNTNFVLKFEERHLLASSIKLVFRDGAFEIQIYKDVTSIYEYTNSLIAIGLLIIVVVVFLIIAIGSKISKNLLLPIQTMTEQVKAFSIKSLDKRLDVIEAKDELKDLAMQFNSMLDHIEDAYRKQNQFVSDASHELRTPISVINGYSSMLDRWGKKDPAILEESIQAIKDETLQMQNLIEKLLFLARSDRSQIEMEIEKVHLHELVDDLFKETKMIDLEHTIELDSVGESTIYGNNKLIKQMLRIFIENAIKFTESGGSIIFIMRVVGGKTMIAIKDSGVGIPKEDLERVFDRFYRSDKSRTKKSGGSGLGLSIAKWIVDQHGAEVKLYSELGMGTKVEIWFNQKIKLVSDEDILALEKEM